MESQEAVLRRDLGFPGTPPSRLLAHVIVCSHPRRSRCSGGIVTRCGWPRAGNQTEDLPRIGLPIRLHGMPRSGVPRAVFGLGRHGMHRRAHAQGYRCSSSAHGRRQRASGVFARSASGATCSGDWCLTAPVVRAPGPGARRGVARPPVDPLRGARAAALLVLHGRGPRPRPAGSGARRLGG